GSPISCMRLNSSKKTHPLIQQALFITFMDNSTDWKKRVKELRLDKEKHCYFTTNSQTSRWFIDMKVTSIPHVIKYNESGVIIGQEK
ncbi:hypothetical protein, partial [Porphyromonas levii]|uniref:hypothetical protein n=1 Tax=Porphyromonas levii TaxID=28114 RepID=UPI001B8B380B